MSIPLVIGSILSLLQSTMKLPMIRRMRLSCTVCSISQRCFVERVSLDTSVVAILSPDSIISSSFSSSVQSVLVPDSYSQYICLSSDTPRVFSFLFWWSISCWVSLVEHLAYSVENAWQEAEKEIEVAVSAKKLEQKTMNYIPIFLLAFLKLSSRDYMSALYGNLIGVIFMSTYLLAYAGAIKLANKFL